MDILQSMANQNWWPLLPHVILLLTLAVFFICLAERAKKIN
jgi:ABC-type dipeptide/oligopeptide/nickel transport system permease subunit